MPNALRNVLALVAGVLVGGLANTALITLSPSLIPPPAGVDVNNVESMSKAMHLFEPRHFVMPFLAHAAGRSQGRWSHSSLRPPTRCKSVMRSARSFSAAASLRA